jgi:hypothetical protein
MLGAKRIPRRTAAVAVLIGILGTSATLAGYMREEGAGAPGPYDGQQGMGGVAAYSL